MLLPAKTFGSGEAVFVMAMSALTCTAVVAVAVLLAGVGSVVALPAVAELVMVVPFAVFELTLTTIVKTDEPPATSEGFVNISVPVPPTAVLSVRAQPAGVVVDTKVVLAGIASFSVTDWASLGPLFCTVTV